MGIWALRGGATATAMAHFFLYWKPDTVVANRHNRHLGHAASDQFNKIRVGDVLWIVTSEGPGDLVLVGRMSVDKIVGQREAERLLGTTDVWQADYHAICDAPEETLHLDLSSRASRLSFDGTVARLPPRFTGQHLQMMRRLDYSTERFMESIWARRQEAEDEPSDD